MKTNTFHTEWMRVLAFSALLMTAGTSNVQAQFNEETRNVSNRGTVAAEFLAIPIGARATGMGNAVSAVVDDATSIYWNAAGLTGIENTSVTFEYANWLSGINFNFAAIAMPAGGGVLGVGITSMRTDEMEVRTVEQQDGTGETFTAASYALSLSYAKPLTDRFSIGGTAKVVTERIWHSNAGGVAFDIGTMFRTPFRNVRLGASISNFGTKLQIGGDDLLIIADIDPNNSGNNESGRAELRTDQFGMPLTMRIGLAGEVFKSDNARLTLAVDALSPNNSEQFLNVGAEAAFLGGLFALRVGYNELLLPDSPRMFTAGAGLRYGFGSLNMGFDYAYESYRFFSAVNRFTVSLQM